MVLPKLPPQKQPTELKLMKIDSNSQLKFDIKNQNQIRQAKLNPSIYSKYRILDKKLHVDNFSKQYNKITTLK